jgi:nucleoside phosphorylase
MPGNASKMIDRTVDIGIVCTLDLEAAALVRRMGSRQKTIGSSFSVVCGILGGRRTAVVRSDAGRKQLMVAVDALISVHRPKWLIAAGFGVGIDGTLKRGVIVVGTELVNDEGDIEKLEGVALAVAQRIQGATAGRIVSTKSVPRSAASKRELHTKSGAIAADQHSWTMARMCAERGTRIVPIRVLVDDAAHDAEPESRAVFHPSATYRAGGLVGALMSGSGHVGKIWKIKSRAKQHADRLAEFLTYVVPTLP